MDTHVEEWVKAGKPKPNKITQIGKHIYIAEFDKFFALIRTNDKGEIIALSTFGGK